MSSLSVLNIQLPLLQLSKLLLLFNPILYKILEVVLPRGGWGGGGQKVSSVFFSLRRIAAAIKLSLFNKLD